MTKLFHSSEPEVEGCVAVGDGGRARHGQRAVGLVLSLGTKGRDLSFGQKHRRVSGAAGDDGNVFDIGKETVLQHRCADIFGSMLGYPNHPKPTLL